MKTLKWAGSLEAQKQHEEAVAAYKANKEVRKRSGSRKVQKKAVVKIPINASYRSLGFKTYIDYLQGKWWKGKRLQKLQSVRHRCERCSSTKKLQVHHKHYKSLGREKNKDLEVLCDSCHDKEHECLIQCDSHLRAISRQE